MYWEDGAVLKPPPRKTPHLLGLNLRFANVFSIIGWAFLGIGLFNTFIFMKPVSLYKAWSLSAKGQPINGYITNAMLNETAVNEDAEHVYDYEFDFAGKRYSGTSMLKGKPMPEGTRVEVTFVPSHPKISELKGDTRYKGPSFQSLLILIFPTLGFCLVGFSYRRGNRWLATSKRCGNHRQSDFNPAHRREHKRRATI